MNDKPLALRNLSLTEYSSGGMPYEAYRALPQDPSKVRDYPKIFFRQKVVIVTTLIATVLAAYVGFELRTPFYESQVKLLIRAEKLVESPHYRELDNSFKNEVVLTQAEIVKSDPVLARVVKALKLDERPLSYERPFATPIKQFVIDLKFKWGQSKIAALESNKALRSSVALKDLAKHVKVKPIPNTALFSISAKDFSPEAAARIANMISHYYVIFDLEQQMAELTTKYGEKNATVRQLRDETQKFESLLTSPSSSYTDIMGPASVKILQEAPVPLEVVGFPISLILLLAAACGLSLGLVLALLIDRDEPVIRSRDVSLREIPLEGTIRTLSHYLDILIEQEARKESIDTLKLSGDGGDERGERVGQ